MYLKLGKKSKRSWSHAQASFCSQMCEDFDMQKESRCWASNTRPHLFLMTPSKEKTANLRNWCVCVCAPLWWSVCHSCCRSLISARISGHVVSHSAPSLGFYLLLSGLDPELWTTETHTPYFFSSTVSCVYQRMTMNSRRPSLPEAYPLARAFCVWTVSECSSPPVCL